jgi:hypothetical protein
MDKEDARYLSPDQQHERRKQVVRLHKAGHRVMDIVKLCGLSYPTVRKAIDDYEAGGAAAIRSAPRGRIPGDGRSPDTLATLTIAPPSACSCITAFACCAKCSGASSVPGCSIKVWKK